MSKSASAAEARPVSSEEAAGLFTDLRPRSKLVLAVSGGPDSTALLFLMARWRAGLSAGPALCAATVDHGLRPESRLEAEAVGATAARLAVPHAVLHWTGEKSRSGVEAAARAARYRLLCAHARQVGAEAIVLAHTLDEQAETVLMRLAAGSGPAGLSAMRSMERLDGLLLARPLLGLSKERLVATLAREGLAYTEDPMNADPRFARPRLRGARATLAREGLTPQRLARLARRMARAEEVVADAAAELWGRAVLPGPGVRLDGRLLAGAAEELALRVLARAIAAVGGEAHEGTPPVRLQRLESLWNGLKSALGAERLLRRTLADALVAAQTDGTVIVTKAPPRRRNAAASRPNRPSDARHDCSAATKTFTRNDAV